MVLATNFAYDNADRLTGITHETAVATVRASYAYTLDAADRLTSETRTWGSSTDTVTYGYTNDNQLTSVNHTNTSFANESFGYDANGHRDTTGYSTGTGDRITTDGTYNYAYDDEGNLTSKTTISTGNQILYTWDYRNRLTEVDSKIGSVTTTLATFTYDALDRRIGEQTGSTTRSTVFDGSVPVMDFSGSRWLGGFRTYPNNKRGAQCGLFLGFSGSLLRPIPSASSRRPSAPMSTCSLTWMLRLHEWGSYLRTISKIC